MVLSAQRIARARRRADLLDASLAMLFRRVALLEINLVYRLWVSSTEDAAYRHGLKTMRPDSEYITCTKLVTAELLQIG